MANYIVIDQDNFVPMDGEVLDQEDIVDRDGYRDTKTQVEVMIQAGERLNLARREEFDYEEDKEENLDDENPTIRQGFDIIDAERELKNINKRLKEQKKDMDSGQVAAGDKKDEVEK